MVISETRTDMVTDTHAFGDMWIAIPQQDFFTFAVTACKDIRVQFTKVIVSKMVDLKIN